MTSDWSLRAARAAMFAALCVGVSAGGHIAMSHQPIPWWALGAAAEATGFAAFAMARRQRGFPAIAALMLGGELVLHLLFSFAQDGPVTSALPMPMSGSMVMPGSMPMSGSMSMPMSGPMSGPGHGGVGMLAAHVAAGLVCAWWLRCGETAVFGLLRTLVLCTAPMLLPSRPRPLAVPRRAAFVPAGYSTPPVDTGRHLLEHALVRRGPPALDLHV